jgi:CheY-like chemotaxis protein
VIPTEVAVKRALAPLATQGRTLGIELLCEVTTGVGELVLGNERQLIETLVRAVGRAMVVPDSREVRVRLARQFAGFAPSDGVVVTVSSGLSSSESTHLELLLPSSSGAGAARVEVAPGARVLVVTPSVEGARIIVGSVRAAGALATSVLDVGAAHDRLRAACGDGARFDLVYVDDLHGDATVPFLRSLREEPRFGRALALVATAQPIGSREHFAREGAVAVLSKPVLPRELGATMARVLLVGSRSSRPPMASASLRVLLAEGDAVNALLTRRALEELGHDVVEVQVGPRVVDAMARDLFDVVLLDMANPAAGALEVARALNAGCAERWPALMVVALVGAEMDDATFERAGIQAVLEKPVSLERLAAVLTRCAAAAPPSGPRILCAPSVAIVAEDVLDLEDLRARTGDDEALIAELFQDFLRHGERWSETLHEAAEAQAFADLSPLAHRLRGALSALGARRAGAAAAEVEAHSFAIAAGTAGAVQARALLAVALTDLTQGLVSVRLAMREFLEAAPNVGPASSSRR